jgi:hypothetical protein
MIGAIKTALTLGKNFGPWFAGVALAAFIAGNATGFKGGRWLSSRDVATAKLELSELKMSAAQARLDAKEREGKIMAQAKEQYDAQTDSIAAVATELRSLSAGVRVCTQVSTMSLRNAAATTGPAAPATSGVARPADVVLQELAAAFAKRADDNAAAYNSVMERWEKIAKDGT